MSFRKVSALIVAVAISAAVPTVARAATFDFAAMAEAFYASNSYEPTWAQMTSGSGGMLSDGGIDVTASATYFGGAANPFFDSSTGMGGRVAGLGVCHESSCSTNVSGAITSDDNLGLGEVLTLQFSQTVAVTNMFVRDEEHYPIGASGAILALMINGMSFYATNGIVNLTGLLASDTFAIQTVEGGLPEIYLSSASVTAVPIPTSGLLLMGGLAGLLILKRRRRGAAD